MATDAAAGSACATARARIGLPDGLECCTLLYIRIFISGSGSLGRPREICIMRHNGDNAIPPSTLAPPLPGSCLATKRMPSANFLFPSRIFII
ncbi:hypothetical protein GQ55_4G124600 [Panicum hallii var. hallii]|uniref:Uncharacterized protein n=1 Tax=Panicum hallii var. hallii TaxID=1504633 RepID=A0A2T7DXX3_9POAL|nr:hypothetical protein GQ55_4G124600 [Panicum hallii var. hallii]